MATFTGTVVWFNYSKGFGFLTRKNGPDVFFPLNAIVAEDGTTLTDGDEVEFDVNNSESLQAIKVMRKANPPLSS